MMSPLTIQIFPFEQVNRKEAFSGKIRGLLFLYQGPIHWLSIDSTLTMALIRPHFSPENLWKVLKWCLLCWCIKG